MGSALSRAGIESWIQEGAPEDATRIVSVAADQLEAAEAVASQPIPNDILQESQQESPEWVAPRCPKMPSRRPGSRECRPLQQLALRGLWRPLERSFARFGHRSGLIAQEALRNGKSRPATGQLFPQGE